VPAWVYTFIAVGVFLVWGAANVVAWADPAASAVPTEMHVIMGAVVGGMFGGQALHRQKARERERERAE
jgi:hypothetical protein